MWCQRRAPQRRTWLRLSMQKRPRFENDVCICTYNFTYVTIRVTPTYCLTISGIFFYEIQLDGLGHPSCCKDLQHLEQEEVFPPSLGSFGIKILHIWSHCLPTTDSIHLIIYIRVFPV